MNVKAKDIFLKSEGDAYFIRNKDHINQGYISQGTRLMEKFIDRNDISVSKILEIGCCSAYNLLELHKRYSCNCWGIEPSSSAISYARTVINDKKLGENIFLQQGTIDFLPYEDNMFDFVLVGFCLFWVDRALLFKSITEVDRVLKPGGYIILEDFDTIVPYKRINKHNGNTPTYKLNYSELFLSNPQYYLCEKHSYSHKDLKFDTDIQERVSTYILYKERKEIPYIEN